jgi:Reverse transcriptase (RNA-dependent DNA polymerase)
MTRYGLSWVPDLVLDKALREEVANCKPIADEVLLSTVPCNANVVSSHTLHRAKLKDDGKFRFKARIVPHGNRDLEKDRIRGESKIACHSSYRTVMALSVVLGLKLVKVDFTAVFLKNKSRRDVYVHPPSDLLLFGKAWLLLATAYGITGAGRLFQLLSDETLTKKMGMEAIHGVKQLFVKRDCEGYSRLVPRMYCKGTLLRFERLIESSGLYYGCFINNGGPSSSYSLI